MTTKMAIAFVTSPSVTMKTPLGRRILEIASKHARVERQQIIHRIQLKQANLAASRVAFEADGNE